MINDAMHFLQESSPVIYFTNCELEVRFILRRNMHKTMCHSVFIDPLKIQQVGTWSISSSLLRIVSAQEDVIFGYFQGLGDLGSFVLDLVQKGQFFTLISRKKPYCKTKILELQLNSCTGKGDTSTQEHFRKRDNAVSRARLRMFCLAPGVGSSNMRSPKSKLSCSHPIAFTF